MPLPVPIEDYLRQLERLLHQPAERRRQITRELRAFAADVLEAHGGGADASEEIIRRVLGELGDVAELAHRFNAIGQTRRMLMNGTLTAACIGLVALGASGLLQQATTVVQAEGQAAGKATVRPERPAPADATQRPDEGERRTADVLAALQRRQGEVHFQDTPLEQVVESLRELMKVNLLVMWSQLEDAGLNRDRPVTLVLRDVSLATVLRLVLDLAGGEVALDYDVRDGVLIVATREYLARWLETRAYDVDDLLLAAERSPDAGLGSGPPGERLLDLLVDTVAPDGWTQNGGQANARVFDGALVVRASRATQRDITTWLAELRKAGVGRARAERPAPASGTATR